MKVDGALGFTLMRLNKPFMETPSLPDGEEGLVLGRGVKVA